MYKLIGPDGKQYLSEEPGTLGGHRGMKIYGRLDCRSALQAIAAGYRPCHTCMREHWKLWQEGRLSEIFSKNFSEKA